MTQFYLDDERTELERVADVAAIAIAARPGAPAGARRPLPDAASATSSSGSTASAAARTTGHGPAPRRHGRCTRARGGRAASDDDYDGELVVAVPVTDGGQVTGVVRAASDYSGVRLRIAGTWALMLGLGALADRRDLAGGPPPGPPAGRTAGGPVAHRAAARRRRLQRARRRAERHPGDRLGRAAR